MLVALGAAAGVAVENARLYEAARRQQRWIAGQRRGHHRGCCPAPSPARCWRDITRQARELSGADLVGARAARRGGARADGHLRRRRRRGGGPRPGAAGRPVAVRAGAGHRRAGDSRPISPPTSAPPGRRAGRDEPDRARGGVPAGRAGQRRGVLTIGRRHGAAPFPPGGGDVRGLVRRAGRRRARAGGQPGRGRAAVGATRTGTGSPATCTTWSSSGCTRPGCRCRAPCR